MADFGEGGRRIGGQGFRGVMALLSSFLTILLTGCGGGGGSSSAPAPESARSAVTARASLTGDGNGADVVSTRVTWGVPAGVVERNIVEYRVLRDGEIVGVTSRGVRQFEDTTKERSFTYLAPSADLKSLATATVNAAPLPVGVSHRYDVEIVYSVLQGGANLYRTGFFLERSGRVTPLTRPFLDGISDAGPPVDGLFGTLGVGAVAVTFRNPLASDSYIVEFADNREFRNKKTWGPLVALTGGIVIFSPSFDLSPTFGAIPPGTQIYYRVGVRNAADAPGPLTEDTATPNADTYLYSAASNFRVAPRPPATP